MFILKLPLFIFTLVSLVRSSPARVDDCGPTINCNAVTKVVGALKPLGAKATSFCSSYLSISPTITQRTTLMPATVTVATSTVTVEVIQSECPAPAKRDLYLLSDDDLNAPAILEKRINLPALSAFSGPQLSSGCRCLSLSPRTTITLTSTPPASTVNTIATTTSCITCTPNGQECTFDRPDLCCGLACLRVLPPVPGGPEATCISF